jgi:MoaA/NifB/PqqE/SkfB family radical SAM enzyme
MAVDQMNAPERWRNALDEPEFEKNMRREAPVFANINLLGRCNVDCYFCLGKDIETEFKKQNQLAVHFSKWANFEHYLLKCEQAGIQRIYVTGQNTDSLMYRYLGELVEHVQSRGFDVGLRTNGYLAHKNMEVINQCRRNVGYSIHSLDPETNWKIMHRRDLPDWECIIPATRNTRVSVVLNRYNEHEFMDLLKYISRFENVAYIQARRICTDTREAFLIEDVMVYERVFEAVKREYPLVGYFYGAEIFSMFGKEVCFWRTVKTTIESFNYYTDGTINDEYFVIEGYMREAQSYPRLGGIPVKIEGLEGYWRG